MNFKPTPLKLILVIIVGLIPGYYTFLITSIVEGTRPPDWFYNSLLQGLVVFLVVAIVVYLAYSFLQKKK